MPNPLVCPCDSYEFVFRDSWFTRVQNVDNYAMLQEFYKQVIMDPCNIWMFPHFSNLYVLVASYASDELCKPGERTWKQILSPEQYEVLRCNHQMIIGYMHVDATNIRFGDEEYHGLTFIDTRVRGEGLAAYMLFAYLIEQQKVLIPFEIVPDAENYWKRYLDEIVGDEVGMDDMPIYVRNNPYDNLKLDYHKYV